MLLPFVYTLIFMGGIYAWKFFKRGLKLKKNDKYKTLTVSIMVFIMCIIHMSIYNINSLRDCLQLNLDLKNIIFPIVCNTFLFTGPLFQLYLDDDLMYQFKRHSLKQYSNIKKLVIAPLLEEITFRVLFNNIYGEFSEYRIYSSIFFSLAHMNHGIRIYRKKYNLRQAILQTMFIMMFTFIFGYYSATVFGQTKSLTSVMILHSYCNFMGFPQILSIFQNSKFQVIKILFVYLTGIVFFYYYINM